MRRFSTAFLLLLVAAGVRAADAPKAVSVFIPVVGSVMGLNAVHWQTDVDLFNDGRSEANVLLSLPTARDQPFVLVTIPPQSGQHFGDIVGQTFGMEATLSPLKITTIDSNRTVRVSANVYGVRGADVFRAEPIGVTYGATYFPLRALAGLSFSETFRTNIGLANLGDHEAIFTLALQRVAGRNVAVTRFRVSPNALVHTSVQSLFPLITKGDDFTLLIETSAPDTYVYASVIDNESNTTHFVAPSIGSPVAEQTTQQAQNH
jgi:hypothetical protein